MEIIEKALAIAEQPGVIFCSFGIGFETTAPANAMTVHQAKRLGIENAHVRVVPDEGNPVAMEMLRDVFEVTDRTWRGIGMIPLSGRKLSERYADFEAETRFSVGDIHTDESPLWRMGRGAPGSD